MVGCRTFVRVDGDLGTRNLAARWTLFANNNNILYMCVVVCQRRQRRNAASLLSNN